MNPNPGESMKAFAIINGNRIELPADLTFGQALDMSRHQAYNTETHQFSDISIVCDGDALPDQTEVLA